ncbi:MAG: hypothetical protein WBA76_06350 [Phormidesmis sp.]
MAANQPLKGIALVDCAKANAPQGAEVAARLCGYGTDVSSFQSALKQAGKDMGITLDDIEDLITDQFTVQRTQGQEIAPESTERL